LENLNASAEKATDEATPTTPISNKSRDQVPAHAFEVITGAGHNCAAVTDAQQLSDGSTLATCSDGERYRVGSISPGQPEFALKCSAMEQRGVEGGC
jgi:hypothetical protein